MAYMTSQQALELAVQRFREGALGDAENLLRQILIYHSDSFDVLHMLGVVVNTTGRAEEGAQLIRRALQVDPSSVDAWKNLGAALIMLDRGEEAVDAFRRAAELKPDVPASLESLGAAYLLMRRYDEAIAAFRKVRAIRAAVLQANPAHVPSPNELSASHNLLTLLHFQPTNDARTIFEDHAIWNRMYAAPLAPQSPSYPNDRTPDRRLKIGYVSAYLGGQPVGRFMSGLLSYHDHAQFEVFCYSDLRSPDETTAKLRAYADTWRDTVELNPEQLAQQVRADGIDILIDLNMHAAGNRMLTFARKPAPVQVTYLAYCSTTGLSAIDYRLSDAAFDPDDSLQPFYAEKTARLKSYWCFPAPAEAPEVSPLPTLAHPGGAITFGCMNDFAKASDSTFAIWIDLLHSLPSSRFVLHAPNTADQQRALAKFDAGGIDRSRIDLVGTLSKRDYFTQYQQIDIALDPMPWVGGTTTCDSLWMGVPVVTLITQTPITRGGLSILSQLGLTEWVANNPERYIAIAKKLASDLPALSAIRAGLRERMRTSPLMDAVGFTRDFESVLRRMWQRWCEN